MKPNKAEVDALKAVLMTPLSEFVTDKEREGWGEEKAETMAQTRMFTQALEAAERARGQRTTYTVVLRHGRTSVHYSGFGPYSTQSQAQKAYTELGSSMEHTAVAFVPTRNEHHLTELFAELDADPRQGGSWAEIKKDVQARKNGWRGKQSERERFLT